MKYYIIGLVFICLLLYYYKSLKLQTFRENLAIGQQISYFEKNKKSKGEITSIKRNILGKITFVYVNNVILHIESVYK
jgi:hypothetical protein